MGQAVFFVHLEEKGEGPFVPTPVRMSVPSQKLTVAGNRLRGEDPYVSVFNRENAVFIFFIGGLVHEAKVAGVKHPCVSGVVETISTSDRYRVVAIGLRRVGRVSDWVIVSNVTGVDPNFSVWGDVFDRIRSIVAPWCCGRSNKYTVDGLQGSRKAEERVVRRWWRKRGRGFVGEGRR